MHAIFTVYTNVYNIESNHTIKMLQSQVSPTQPVDTVIEEPSVQLEEPNDGKVFGVEHQLGGKDSRMSASHVIVRSKLHFDGDARPLSKSTSRIGEALSDTVPLPKQDEEDICPIPEDPPAIVQSEGVAKS